MYDWWKLKIGLGWPNTTGKLIPIYGHTLQLMSPTNKRSERTHAQQRVWRWKSATSHSTMLTEKSTHVTHTPVLVEIPIGFDRKTWHYHEETFPSVTSGTTVAYWHSTRFEAFVNVLTSAATSAATNLRDPIHVAVRPTQPLQRGSGALSVHRAGAHLMTSTVLKKSHDNQNCLSEVAESLLCCFIDSYLFSNCVPTCFSMHKACKRQVGFLIRGQSVPPIKIPAWLTLNQSQHLGQLTLHFKTQYQYPHYITVI